MDLLIFLFSFSNFVFKLIFYVRLHTAVTLLWFKGLPHAPGFPLPPSQLFPSLSNSLILLPCSLTIINKMLICLAGSTPALQSWSNLDSMVSFALVYSCSFGVVVSFSIQIHISFHKNILFFFLTYFISFFVFRPRKRDYSSIYCSDFHILVLIHSTVKNTTFHYHPFLLSCELWILSFFPKYYGFSL